MRKGSAGAQSDILDGKQKFPRREHYRKFAPGGQENINRENEQISRQDAQGAPREEATKLDAVTVRERRHQLAADQVTA